MNIKPACGLFLFSVMVVIVYDGAAFIVIIFLHIKAFSAEKFEAVSITEVINATELMESYAKLNFECAQIYKVAD